MRATAFAFTLAVMAVTSNVAGAAEPAAAEISYNIAISEETPEGKVTYVSNSTVLTLNRQTVPINMTRQSAYLVLVQCSPSPCDDRWTDTKRLVMKLTPDAHDGIVDTKVEILGGQGKGRTEPEPRHQVLAATFRSASGDQIVMPLAFPYGAEEGTMQGSNIKHVVKITPFQAPRI